MADPIPVATSNIVSHAFRLMEMPAISSFGDGSPEAIAAAEHYPVVLGFCLELCDWSFASQLANLQLANNMAVDPALPYSYIRPTDLVRLQEVHPECARWRLDKDALRADQPAPLSIRYTATISNEENLPATFRNLVSYRLAAELARFWTKSVNRTESLERSFERVREAAMRADARTASSQRYDGRDISESTSWTSQALR